MKGPILASFMLAAPAASACDIALMLAVDVSGSVDADEFRIQMDGLAAALTDRSIAAALVASKAELALMQWTGTGRHSVVLSGTKIEDPADVYAVAVQLAPAPRLWRDFPQQ